jgi:DNA-binding CsgD family transcriptional regulator
MTITRRRTRGHTPWAVPRRSAVRCRRGHCDNAVELEGGHVSAAALVERWPLVGRWELLETCSDLLASDGCDGIVLAGAAGVGKTRLADEVRATAADHGWTAVRAIASRTAAGTPLGALAHLLPPDAGTAEPAARFVAVAEALRDASGAQQLWVIDDAHLLDGASLVLLTQLVASRLVFLLMTVRSGEGMPDALTALMRSEPVVRLDLPTLERDELETLLHMALGGPVDTATTTSIWDATLGNALFTRELVHGSRSSGALAERDGLWMLDGALHATPRVTDFVEERIAGLEPDARRLLEAIAAVGPIGLDRATAIASTETVARVEEQDLIALVADERRHTVALAHPVYGDVLRTTTSVIRQQTIQREMADYITSLGARRREDALRMASWQLAGGAHADGALLLRAAKVARYAHDFAQAERLARAAEQEQTNVDSLILLGEALFELGRFEDADPVLRAAEDASTTDDELTAAATMRSTNTFWGLLDPDAARAIRSEARERVDDKSSATVLRAGEAAILVFSSRPTDALELLGPADPDDDLRSRVARAIAEAPALARRGRTQEAIAVARQGFADHVALGDAVAVTNPGAHLVSQALALTEAGRLADALELVTAMHEVATRQRIPIARIWATSMLARVSFVQGRLATAHRWFLEAAAIAAASRHFGPRRLMLAGLSMASAQLGDSDGATSAAGELAAAPGVFDFLQGEQALGHAWAAVARNELATAREIITEAVVLAAANGERTSEAWLLHDLARLGTPAGTEDRLAELAAATDSPLVGARAAHVAALVARDGAGLNAACDSFEELGAMLLAAEAAAAASNAFRFDGDQRHAAAARERSIALAALCEGARTPGLVVADTAVALSPRELDVARLAASGLASKDIGERLYISTRTVDNHLQRVFTKLGVTRRSELADALDLRGSDDDA